MGKNWKYNFQLFAGICCLVIYHVTLFSSYSEFAHVEHAHEEVHSLENELDTCHRAIYHGEEDTDHNNHLSETDSTCAFCLFSISSHISTTYLTDTGFDNYILISTELSEVVIYSAEPSTLHNKAPPVV